MNPNRRRGRFFGTLVMAAASVAFLAQEWDYRRQRVESVAVVLAPGPAFGRSGLAISDVLHRVDGRDVRATLRSFHHRFDRGERVPILHLPDEPHVVVPDLYWQRRFGSTIALGFLAAFALWETAGAQGLRRRRGILLEDPDTIDLHGLIHAPE